MGIFHTGVVYRTLHCCANIFALLYLQRDISILYLDINGWYKNRYNPAHCIPQNDIYIRRCTMIHLENYNNNSWFQNWFNDSQIIILSWFTSSNMTFTFALLQYCSNSYKRLIEYYIIMWIMIKGQDMCKSKYELNLWLTSSSSCTPASRFLISIIIIAIMYWLYMMNECKYHTIMIAIFSFMALLYRLFPNPSRRCNLLPCKILRWCRNMPL